MTLNRTGLKSRLSTPAAALAIGVLVAASFALLPGRWTGSIRGAAATVLRPGQVAALRLRRHGGRTTTWLRSHLHTAARLAEAEDELRRLAQANRRLAAELAAARSRLPGAPGDSHAHPQRLLIARCVTARVLGQQARGFLARHHLLDVGAGDGVEPDALVVDGPAVIDRGRQAGLAPGQPVLSGRRVWGKIIEVGRNTSVVRGVAEAGYRELVHVGTPSGPQGLLEGTGQPLARIRLVEVTEPVTVGDPVYAAGGKGVVPAPLLCGRIVRLERPVGAACWEIWMQPAVTDHPEQVAVLRVELNPLRMTEKGAGTGAGPSAIRQ